MPHRPVRQVIAGQQILAAPATLTVTEAARLMQQGNSGALIVVDGARQCAVHAMHGSKERSPVLYGQGHGIAVRHGYAHHRVLQGAGRLRTPPRRSHFLGVMLASSTSRG